MPQVGKTKYLTRMGWDHAPHLTEEKKENMLSMCPPHLRMARRDGLPTVGIGRIYPLSWEKVSIDPFPLPKHWKRFYALDPGWNRTAALWGVIDPESDTLYWYSEYYEEEMLPHQHAVAIKTRGEWMRGVSDPAAAGSTQEDGRRLIDSYKKSGLHLKVAENTVEAGLSQVWTRIRERRMLVFNTLSNFKYEYNQYHRDKNGKVVKKNDHLMDCCRYGIMSGLAVAAAKDELVRPASNRRGAADQRAGF